jgi:hypothetical protein
MERRNCVGRANDCAGVIGKVKFQCRLHLLPFITSDRILHKRHVVSEFGGVTHCRIDAGIRLSDR